MFMFHASDVPPLITDQHDGILVEPSKSSLNGILYALQGVVAVAEATELESPAPHKA